MNEEKIDIPENILRMLRDKLVGRRHTPIALIDSQDERIALTIEIKSALFKALDDPSLPEIIKLAVAGENTLISLWRLKKLFLLTDWGLIETEKRRLLSPVKSKAYYLSVKIAVLNFQVEDWL